MSRRAHWSRQAALGLTALVACTGCGVGLGDLPLPAPGVRGDKYLVHAAFANALNLPAAAKVRLAGAEIGEVTEMAVRDYTAIVTLGIRADVRLPKGTRAELRTATPLGDVFVSLTPPPEATADGPALADGDDIPLESTAQAATIEELLATVSLLVNGGAIRNLSTIVNGLGRTVGDRGERMADLIERSTRVVAALTARSQDIRTTLAEVDQLTRRLDERGDTIDQVLAAAGPALATLRADADHALTLVRQVDAISERLARFPGLDGQQGAGLIADVNTIADQLDAAARTPGASVAAMNAMLGPLMKVLDATSASTDADMQDLAIGFLPDPNHPGGDPASRLPDQRDWENFIGSFTYTLLKLQGRLNGAGR
ncbi:MlaD family protein [Nocardia takedensis]|uniref:MlaD family protein n=1 Tax=Nocardia takedensis TaxID=259390 RepID=UPI00030F7BEC|nr:MlaD family protein [Nocardia takedensis]